MVLNTFFVSCIPGTLLWSFWHDNRFKLPSWYALAKEAALIQPSSAYVERLFFYSSFWHGREAGEFFQGPNCCVGPSQVQQGERIRQYVFFVNGSTALPSVMWYVVIRGSRFCALPSVSFRVEPRQNTSSFSAIRLNLLDATFVRIIWIRYGPITSVYNKGLTDGHCFPNRSVR